MATWTPTPQAKILPSQAQSASRNIHGGQHLIGDRVRGWSCRALARAWMSSRPRRRRQPAPQQYASLCSSWWPARDRVAVSRTGNDMWVRRKYHNPGYSPPPPDSQPWGFTPLKIGIVSAEEQGLQAVGV